MVPIIFNNTQTPKGINSKDPFNSHSLHLIIITLAKSSCKFQKIIMMHWQAQFGLSNYTKQMSIMDVEKLVAKALRFCQTEQIQSFNTKEWQKHNIKREPHPQYQQQQHSQQKMGYDQQIPQVNNSAAAVLGKRTQQQMVIQNPQDYHHDHSYSAPSKQMSYQQQQELMLKRQKLSESREQHTYVSTNTQYNKSQDSYHQKHPQMMYQNISQHTQVSSQSQQVHGQQYYPPQHQQYNERVIAQMNKGSIQGYKESHWQNQGMMSHHYQQTQQMLNPQAALMQTQMIQSAYHIPQSNQEISKLKSKPQLSFHTLLDSFKKYKENLRDPKVVNLSEISQGDFEKQVDLNSRQQEKRDRVGDFFLQVIENTSCKFIRTQDESLIQILKPACDIYQEKRKMHEYNQSLEQKKNEEEAEENPEIQYIDEETKQRIQKEFQEKVSPQSMVCDFYQIKKMLQNMINQRFEILEYIKDDINFRIKVQNKESSIITKTVILFIDCDLGKAYIIEIARINSLIGREEHSSGLKILFDINQLSTLFDEQFFNKYLNKQAQQPLLPAQNQVLAAPSASYDQTNRYSQHHAHYETPKQPLIPPSSTQMSQYERSQWINNGSSSQQQPSYHPSNQNQYSNSQQHQQSQYANQQQQQQQHYQPRQPLLKTQHKYIKQE
ncbi:UNKNOWN [Stylonychia lemnae]|uniref:Uncharacterized protein n=1 Tax=Stylonychia lemnae TaxID=5949 RepID=A0A078A3K0_STYLE|nr:UNKNOWN [Stylonychia lemnae]|eukprot:CDW76103.1 UNKNOWN [Stylonychia lemnae]